MTHKIYVVYGKLNRGYSQPEIAFLSEYKANKYVKIERNNCFEPPEIKEIELH